MDFRALKKIKIGFILAILLFAGNIPKSIAQFGDSYELTPAPDLWYNSVDGIRIGVRLKGSTPDSFGDGPHRLNTGVWLGTKFPEHPVSYYFSFTEPIPSLSDFGSEANISLESSFRTGFQFHGLTFSKRWQPGFDELNFTELSVGARAEHRFDEDYLLYNQLWQDDWLYPVSAELLSTNTNGAGRYAILVSADANIAGSYPGFFRAEIAFNQNIPLSDYFKLSGRLYTGFATDKTAPEYLFSHSFNSARGWMDHGLTRARGTISPTLMESGSIQITGGPGLRGYLHQDTEVLNSGLAPLYTSLSAVNVELDYPNPLDRAFKNVPIVGKFTSLRSYIFFDGGTSLGVTDIEEPRLLTDAGPGFMLSVNIPDYLGKSRGLMLRYDLPLWLSHPGEEDHFKFRHVIGIGAIISL
ncbi:hypothetical protein [Fodinibius salsisoli]|uniref:Surface antigen n=1 Tax=Fodinibius salsisoli TaxID=2820877 RepID=A0ABT3PKE6_9BACT|nr:hypothetical protein [Fodinibius salsisoli]MCW9706330.1 hypothetical protein [Fodinibius salsisoli]